MRHFNHLNVVASHGFVFDDPEKPMLVMEYCTLGSLLDILPKEPNMLPDEKKRALRDIAAGT